MPAYQVKIDASKLRLLIDRTRWPIQNPDIVQKLGLAVRKYGAMVQAAAVHNVSGYPVVYDGGAFRVQVRTGTLKSSIELQWPYGSLFSARVYVNGSAMTPEAAPGGWYGKPQSVASYAMAVEKGHKQIDLKLTMMGKTVPFFASRGAKSKGPYAARGLNPLNPQAQGVGTTWTSEALNAKLAGQGKGAMIFTKHGGGKGYSGGSSSYFISFRKVGRTGWIIPAAKPRPFMLAAAQNTRERGRLLIVNAGVEMLNLR